MPDTAPINNWLFGAMSSSDQGDLLPHLERRDVSQGETLARAGDPMSVVHFPTSAHIANLMTLDTGQSMAVSMVGREGVTGLAAFMANEPIGWDVITHIGGIVWSARAGPLRSLAERSSDLSHLLLQATHCNQLEASANAICATVHPIKARLARWLLTIQERTGLTSLLVTQDELAKLLGAQRTTVAVTLGQLREGGALGKGTRGRIAILDRAVLKAAACRCSRRTPDFAYHQ